MKEKGNLWKRIELLSTLNELKNVYNQIGVKRERENGKAIYFSKYVSCWYVGSAAAAVQQGQISQFFQWCSAKPTGFSALSKKLITYLEVLVSGKWTETNPEQLPWQKGLMELIFAWNSWSQFFQGIKIHFL